jgi:Ca-activated chloride channel family protein
MKGEHKLGDALESVSDALGHLGAEDDFGLVAYSNAAGEVLPLGPVSDPAGARSILSGLRAGGATNLSAALRVGEELLQNSTKRRRLLILSDGMPNRGLTSTERLVAESARLYEEGISVSAVGLGVNLNEELLIRMAEAGGGEYTHCRDACCLGAVLALELARARWSDGASRRGP